MIDCRSCGEREESFEEFKYSGRWGSHRDPDSGLVLYRGSAGPGTIEFSYDPETHEVVNGQVREIDMCR